MNCGLFCHIGISVLSGFIVFFSIIGAMEFMEWKDRREAARKAK